MTRLELIKHVRNVVKIRVSVLWHKKLFCMCVYVCACVQVNFHHVQQMQVKVIY